MSTNAPGAGAGAPGARLGRDNAPRSIASPQRPSQTPNPRPRCRVAPWQLSFNQHARITAKTGRGPLAIFASRWIAAARYQHADVTYRRLREDIERAGGDLEQLRLLDGLQADYAEFLRWAQALRRQLARRAARERARQEITGALGRIVRGVYTRDSACAPELSDKKLRGIAEGCA